MTKIDFKKLLDLYVENISNFNEFLKVKYQFKDLPFNKAGKLFNKVGAIKELNIIRYQFHGGGCSIEYSDGIEIHFNYIPVSNERIKTSPWKFYMFVSTWVKKNKLEFEVSEQDVQEALVISESKGQIVKLNMGNAYYEILEK